ncbi:hypothetical protein GGI25_002945 [Coemansia spiralis]|uniref:DM14 domain-containing protein n=2 Tax=Coemansia TaxID=4863 RepID=A0A9W8G6X6_9FUNG|nr:hypothetical protein EDC05_002391 [Coemansia umbellata]KAJ2621317.1 hypothetical protein GGI26_004194 [Coemansia sp. RSA 1358]KAJ2677700.1 hypothetical protein GGI25_002945 [Coemansia spiralis]
MYLIAGRGRNANSSRSSQRFQTSNQPSASPADISPLPAGRSADNTPGGDQTNLVIGDVDVGALDIAGDYGDDDDGAPFDDAALDDPELLGELDALRREMGLSEPHCPLDAVSVATKAAVMSSASSHSNTIKTRSNSAHNPPFAYSAALPSEDENDSTDDEVVVTEEDMNDPVLLAELAEYSSHEIASNESSNARFSVQKQQQQQQHKADRAPGQIGAGDNTINTLKQRHQEFKTLALASKRQGDMNHAREMLAQMKNIQAALDIVQAGKLLPSDFIIPPIPATKQQDQRIQAQKQNQDQQPPQKQSSNAITEHMLKASPASSIIKSRAADSLGPAARPANTALSPANKSALQPHSPAAAASKRVKALTSTEQTKNIDLLGSNNIENMDKQSSDFKALATSFAAMRNKLESQNTQATRLAAYFLKTGDKTLALDFHRLKKRSAADLATVSSFEANGRKLPPPFLHREVQWTVPVEQRRDISINELQIAVNRIFSEGDLAATLGGKSDFYIQWELGWPRDKGNKGYTRTIKYSEFESGNGTVNAGYLHNIEFVDRHNTRPLQRWIERGKLVVELYKYMGLIWGSQLIGRASLPLVSLRTKSEASLVAEIKAASDGVSRAGKPLLGGPIFVDVAARLRLPLTNKPELISHSERWIYIDDQEAENTQQQTQAGLLSYSEAGKSNHGQLSPEKGTKKEDAESDILNLAGEQKNEPTSPDIQQSAGESIPQEQQQQQNEEPVDGTAAAATIAATATTDSTKNESSVQSIDDIAGQLDVVDGVVSNAVLEMELLQIPARLQNTKDKEQANVLHDLETSIKLRMSVVAAQVGAGTLTIQDYMVSVTKELQQATEWALVAKKQGHKDVALRALKRVKTMRNEIDEMKAAMETEE